VSGWLAGSRGDRPVSENVDFVAGGFSIRGVHRAGHDCRSSIHQISVAVFSRDVEHDLRIIACKLPQLGCEHVIAASRGTRRRTRPASRSRRPEIWFHTHPGLGSDPRRSPHDDIVDKQLGDLFRFRSGAPTTGHSSPPLGQAASHSLASSKMNPPRATVSTVFGASETACDSRLLAAGKTLVSRQSSTVTFGPLDRPFSTR
jgi:hypothetical protein